MYQALSTGQAARFCYVTPESILNWIHSGRLRAQRTAGGQYRILVDDLRRFMVENGMDTTSLHEDQDARPYCWEFHGEAAAKYGNPRLEVCEGCLVKRSGTLNCWELHGLLPVTGRRIESCDECDYHHRYGPREEAAAGQSNQPMEERFEE
jgi:excisionase family DNA binding protein